MSPHSGTKLPSTARAVHRHGVDGVIGVPGVARLTGMDDTLRRLLRRQDNVLSREQALAAGFTKSAIRHNLTAGRRWQVVVPGVYATFSGPLTERHRLRAALLHAGEPSWLTGLSVCRLWELRYLPIRIPKVEVLVLEGRRVRAVSFVDVSRTSRPPEKTWWFEGFPTVPPARAVITAARSFVDLREVRAALRTSTARDGHTGCVGR